MRHPREADPVHVWDEAVGRLSRRWLGPGISDGVRVCLEDLLELGTEGDCFRTSNTCEQRRKESLAAEAQPADRPSAWVTFLIAMLSMTACGDGTATTDTSTATLSTATRKSTTGAATTTPVDATTTSTTTAIGPEPPVINLVGWTTVFSKEGDLVVEGGIDSPGQVRSLRRRRAVAPSRPLRAQRVG